MATNSFSTRVTFRYVGLARKLALARKPIGPSGINSAYPPAVRLAARCLRVSESLLQAGRNGAAADRDWNDIAAVLSSATEGGRVGAERFGHALAVLHFVERTLGLSNQRYRRRSASASFAQRRVRSQK